MISKTKKIVATSLAALSLATFAGGIADSAGIPVLGDNTITADAVGLMYYKASKENVKLIKSVTKDLHPVFDNPKREELHNGDRSYYENFFKTVDANSRTTGTKYIKSVLSELKEGRFVTVSYRASARYAGWVIYGTKYRTDNHTKKRTAYLEMYCPKTGEYKTISAISAAANFDARRLVKGPAYSSFTIMCTIQDMIYKTHEYTFIDPETGIEMTVISNELD